MKNISIKVKIVSIVVALLLVAGIIVGIVIGTRAKDESKPLTVTISDIEVKVGETAEINFTVSNKLATTTFKIENEAIAKLEQNESKFYVVGVAAGNTTITVEADFKDRHAKANANVKVVSKSSDVGSTEDPIVKDPIENDPIGNDPAETPEIVKPTLKFTNLSDSLTISETKINLSSNTGFFALEYEENTIDESIDFVYDETLFKIELIANAPVANMFKITCSNVGEFSLKIAIGENVFNYILVKA